RAQLLFQDMVKSIVAFYESQEKNGHNFRFFINLRRKLSSENFCRKRQLWFSVFGRRFLKRGDFASMADFEARLLRYVEDYNRCHAHPYRWTYTGTPLVRGTPFSQIRRQQRQGRAWFSPRPQQFERLLYPPRPYKRHTKKTG